MLTHRLLNYEKSINKKGFRFGSLLFLSSGFDRLNHRITVSVPELVEGTNDVN